MDINKFFKERITDASSEAFQDGVNQALTAQNLLPKAFGKDRSLQPEPGSLSEVLIEVYEQGYAILHAHLLYDNLVWMSADEQCFGKIHPWYSELKSWLVFDRVNDIIETEQ